MGQLSKERLRKFEDESHLFFDWLDVLRDAGITEIQDLQGQYLLKCPFHEDWSPSFRIRLHEHNYHCFSCNDFGTVAKLMYKLSSQTIPKVQFYERLIKCNPVIQSHLGFNSLFIDAFSLDEGFTGRRRFSAKEHIGSGMPLSVLFRSVKAQGDTWENLVYSLTMLQEGERPDTILHRIKGIKEQGSPVNSPEVSLMSLISDDE